MGAIRRPVYYDKQYFSDVTLNHRYYRLTMDIINEVSIIDRAKMERIPHKTIYHHRSMFIKQLGFSTLQHLQMFLTDINQKDIKLLCSSTRWYMGSEIKEPDIDKTAFVQQKMITNNMKKSIIRLIDVAT